MAKPITVCIIDTGIWARILKEITVFAGDDRFRFVFIATVDPDVNHHYVPWVKTYPMLNVQYDCSQDAVERVAKICREENVDVLHTHNFPDTYGKIGIGVRNMLGIPVVHEIHDMAYENTPPEWESLECEVLRDVDRLICVSDSMLGLIDSKYPGHNVRARADIVYSYPNTSFLPAPNPNPPLNFRRCVYQGGIMDRLYDNATCNHRFYWDIFQRLVAQGVSIDVFPNKPVDSNIGGVVVRGRLPVKELYGAIAGFDFGFVGYNRTPSGVMDIALPNKLFEYICCGIPVLAMRYKNIEDFINRTGVGVLVDDDMSLPPDFDDRMRKAKAMCISQSPKFTMESQKSKLADIYTKLAANRHGR